MCYNCGMMRRWALFTVMLSLAGLAFPVTPEETAANLEKALRGLHSLRARFDQLYFSPSVPDPLHERGELFLQKPDRMRWQYKDPQEKTFLYAGGIVQMYLPEEKQLTRSRVPPEAYESDILGIFLGGSRSGTFMSSRTPGSRPTRPGSSRSNLRRGRKGITPTSSSRSTARPGSSGAPFISNGREIKGSSNSAASGQTPPSPPGRSSSRSLPAPRSSMIQGRSSAKPFHP